MESAIYVPRIPISSARERKRAKRALVHKRSVRLTIRVKAGATSTVAVTLRRG